MRFQVTLALLVLSLAAAGSPAAEQAYPLGSATPEIAHFLGADRYGAVNPEAPPETQAFGRLVGLWLGKVEMPGQDGSWSEGPPALWAWQYVLDGFATQDLWFHSADNLPAYLAALDRSYQLTGLRMYEPGSGRWRVAWVANGGGTAPGMDFGTLEGSMEGEDLVLEARTEFGRQRITFSDVTEKSFLWTSEMSRDGENWTAIMRVHASRLE